MKSVGAPPTSSTTAPATGHLTPPMEETLGLAGPLTEIARWISLLGQGKILPRNVNTNLR